MQPALDRFEHALVDASRRLTADANRTEASTREGVKGLRRRHRRGSALAAVGSIVTAAVVTLILVLSPGTQTAYAGWTAQPAVATASSIRAARGICANGSTGTGAAAYHRAFTRRPTLSETRGIFTTVVEVSGGNLYSCVTGGGSQNAGSHGFRVSNYGSISQAPGPGLIAAPYSMKSGGGGGLPGAAAPPRFNADWSAWRIFLAKREAGGYGPAALGQTGPGVTAVTFTFRRGQTVSAALQNGWYFAWWPWIGYPASVTVATRSGTTTSPLSTRGKTRVTIVPGCQPRSPGCVFAGTHSGS